MAEAWRKKSSSLPMARPMAEGSYIDAEGFLHENPSAMSTKEARSWWYYQMRHNPNQQKQKPTHPNGGYQPYRAGYGAYSG